MHVMLNPLVDCCLLQAFASLETRMGFHPDAGSSFILSCLKGSFGEIFSAFRVFYFVRMGLWSYVGTLALCSCAIVIRYDRGCACWV